MAAMRRAPAWLLLACGLLPLRAAAQTCPPSDPLCTTNRATPAAPAPVLEKRAEDDDQKPEKTKQSKEAPAPSRGVITLAEVTITGRVQKPIAAVDVNRIAPRLTLAELRQPFLDRIERAIYSDPF